jgi:hypothetical protein
LKDVVDNEEVSENGDGDEGLVEEEVGKGIENVNNITYKCLYSYNGIYFKLQRTYTSSKSNI